MEITQKNITIGDLADGYNDNGENGVYAYKGKLDVRPPYQREFLYDDKMREKVIDTVVKKRPLNLMYWSKKLDGTYEIIDGQQRTISICQYIGNIFTHDKIRFRDLTAEEQQAIRDYKLCVFVCEGTEREKLDWFETINIAGKQLTKQELRNASYSGPFVSDAKRMFSKRDCEAQKLMDADGRQLFSGTMIEQKWLETVISWIADRNDMSIEDYMSINKTNDARELWTYFKDIYDWVKAVFPKYRKEMRGIEWGVLYNKYGQNIYDAEKIEERTKELMMDDDVTSKKGIYRYLLSGDEKYLSIRSFTPKMKREAYERQNGICPMCVDEHRDRTQYEFEEMEGDHHKIPWHDGGRTVSENCVMLCKEHNRTKGGR